MRIISHSFLCIVLLLLITLGGCGKQENGLISVKGQPGYVIHIEEENLDQYFTISEIVSQTSILDTRDGSSYFVTVAEVAQGGYIAYSNTWMLNVVYLPSSSEDQLDFAVFYANPNSQNYMSIEEAKQHLPWFGNF